ncbi:hypothetical protein F8388_008701 [Cannabis sativa]|uniref:Uncharacterized protein n=1 Tax=Cannabis sativa TaxID=3483 RepID=A0A7J6HK17_CANSA|nr:hypothetical protein F8388_008701 [Cannabis sativa]
MVSVSLFLSLDLGSIILDGWLGLAFFESEGRFVNSEPDLYTHRASASPELLCCKYGCRSSDSMSSAMATETSSSSFNDSFEDSLVSSSHSANSPPFFKPSPLPLPLNWTQQPNPISNPLDSSTNPVPKPPTTTIPYGFSA